MKNWKPYLLAILGISIMLWISFVQNPKAEELLKDKDQKQEIFHAIINDPKVLSEFMDILIENPENQEKWITYDTEIKDSILHLTNLPIQKKKIIYQNTP